MPVKCNNRRADHVIASARNLLCQPLSSALDMTKHIYLFSDLFSTSSYDFPAQTKKHFLCAFVWKFVKNVSEIGIMLRLICIRTSTSNLSHGQNILWHSALVSQCILSGRPRTRCSFAVYVCGHMYRKCDSQQTTRNLRGYHVHLAVPKQGSIGLDDFNRQVARIFNNDVGRGLQHSRCRCLRVGLTAFQYIIQSINQSVNQSIKSKRTKRPLTSQ